MSVSANANEVQFPRDPWGFTTQLRKAGISAAQSIKGDDEKHRLFLETLGILVQHAQARLDVDKGVRQERLEALAKRNSRSQAEAIPPQGA